MIEKYKGKPVICGNVPFWRHHIFPWGWYKINGLHLEHGDIVKTSGHFKPGDGGDISYEVVSGSPSLEFYDDGGEFIDLKDSEFQVKGVFLKGANVNQWGDHE